MDFICCKKGWLKMLLQPLINFYHNLTSGNPVVYVILFVVFISIIVGYKSAMGDIIRERYWRNKKWLRQQ